MSRIAFMGQRMQELVLPQPGRMAQQEWKRDAADAAVRQEFEALLPDAASLAFRVARGVLRNSADAEDVAQEALLRAYRQFHRLRDRRHFRGWLARIAFRIAIDRTRSVKRREQRENLWYQSAPQPTPADSAAQSEFQSRLENALDALAPKFRMVAVLCAIEGHTHEEVAALLSLPLGTVKSRFFVARRKLAEKLRCLVNTSNPR